MIVCLICKEKVLDHRPNQKICGKTLCKSRHTENNRRKGRNPELKWTGFNVKFFNDWMESCYGR